MKTIKAYEFKDLSIDIQKGIIESDTNDCVNCHIDFLEKQLTNGEINEDEFYNRLGCDKNYAESTGWFVPHCYYEKNKEEVDKEAKAIAKRSLYTKNGKYIQCNR